MVTLFHKNVYLFIISEVIQWKCDIAIPCSQKKKNTDYQSRLYSKHADQQALWYALFSLWTSDSNSGPHPDCNRALTKYGTYPPLGSQTFLEKSFFLYELSFQVLQTKRILVRPNERKN